jgi:hypothetical protein
MMDIRGMAQQTLAEATGHTHRSDEATAPTGGPAGNARLTAWTGLVLLVLFGAELVTLLDVRGLITWHAVIGVLLVPPALLKTATTGWRILRYYTGNRRYRTAGPPPTPLRVLGPLVVASTLAVLGTGIAAVLVGDGGPAVTVLGQPIDTVSIHKATFVVWGVVTGVHTLARLVPALRLSGLVGGARTVPGRTGRVAVIAATLALAVAVGIATPALIDLAPWRTRPPGHSDHDVRGR